MSTENTTPTEAEATAELSKLDDASLYIEERQEQEDVERVESEAETEVRRLNEKLPELKEARKASRYQRLKAGRDRLQAENEELRQKLGQSSEPEQREAAEQRDAYYSETDRDTGINPKDADVDTVQLERSLEAAIHLHGDAFEKAYDAFVEHAHQTRDKATYDRIMQSADPGAELVQWWNEQGNPTASPEALEAAQQQGREQQEFQSQLAARDEQIRAQAELNLRIENFAAQNPKFHEAINEAAFMWEGVNAPVFGELVRRSPLAPDILYLMAEDVFSPNSFGILEQVQGAENNPIEQARLVGALEQIIFVARRKGQGVMQAQGRATKAPPPLSQVRGGSSPPRDLHALAKSDSAEDYIKARRSAR